MVGEVRNAKRPTAGISASGLNWMVASKREKLENLPG